MPTIEEYLRPDVIREVRRLDLRARFIVEGFIAGLHDSPYYGFSSEFSEHSKYNAGDDPKYMDWKVFARTDRYYIKRFEAETNQNCHLLLDVSESMAYGYGDAVSKLEYAICTAAALGYMMTHQQDNVGLITFDEDLTNVVPARCKRSHLVRILSVLDGALRHRPSRLAFCLHKAADLMRRRGLVVLISDLIPTDDESTDDVIGGLKHIRYRGHDLIVFHLLDHAEVTFPFRGPTHFVDTETERTVVADPEAIASAHRSEVGQFIRTYRDACLNEKVDFVQVDTSNSFDAAGPFLRRHGHIGLHTSLGTVDGDGGRDPAHPAPAGAAEAPYRQVPRRQVYPPEAAPQPSSEPSEAPAAVADPHGTDLRVCHADRAARVPPRRGSAPTGGRTWDVGRGGCR
jgi:hypothetical protein